MSEELKPKRCPFCGKKKALENRGGYVICVRSKGGCGTIGPDADSGEEAEAVEKWNAAPRKAKPAVPGSGEVTGALTTSSAATSGYAFVQMPPAPEVVEFQKQVAKLYNRLAGLERTNDMYWHNTKVTRNMLDDNAKSLASLDKRLHDTNVLLNSAARRVAEIGEEQNTQNARLTEAEEALETHSGLFLGEMEAEMQRQFIKAKNSLSRQAPDDDGT